MSLDNIQLPDFVIQDLYKKNLVDLSDSQQVKNITSKEINFFGGNRQQILLLVNNNCNAFVTDEQFTFLSGILNACKLTLEDIALVNIAALPSLSYKTLVKTFHPKIFLMFGISPDTLQLPFVIPDFQRQAFDNKVYLSIPSLNEIENDKELKRKLWIVLKQIFSL